MFQNSKGEIFGCGQNGSGELGLGHYNSPQIQVSPILNVPENIVHFYCGRNQSYFLDCEGNVYSVGNNYYGQLGLGHKEDQNTLNKIPDIPPIQSISSTQKSCYLLDIGGNVWSFGYNGNGELGHGDTTNRNVPKKIESLKSIRQLSYVCCTKYFLAKDSRNKIYALGKLEKDTTKSTHTIPLEITSQYSAGIWIQKVYETMNWKEETNTLDMIQSKIQTVKVNLKLNNNNKVIQEFPQNSFESWNEVHDILNKKSKQINAKLNEKQNIELQHQKDIQTYEMELEDIEHQLQQLLSRKKEIEEKLLKAQESQRFFEETFKEIEINQKTLEEMCNDVSIFCKNEKEMNEDLVRLYSKKKFEEFDCSDISKLLWKMDLTKYQQIFEENQIDGSVVSAMDDDFDILRKLVEKRDYFHILFNFEMMKSAGYSKTFSPDYEHEYSKKNSSSFERV